jgi:hypothetical protein
MIKGGYRMTREEAINHLKTVAKSAIDSGYDGAVVDAVYMAIKALEQEGDLTHETNQIHPLPILRQENN